MYKSLTISDFRLFHGVDIVFGKYITVIAGRNSTGKSTILGLVANSGELKGEKTYLGGRFRAEFSEIFKGSERFDPSGSKRLTLIVEQSGVEQTVEFRTAWQKRNDGVPRFRIIPRRANSDGKTVESKLEFPVIYLGLSRLYPIGEGKFGSLSSQGLKWTSEEDKEWFVSNYKKILTLHDEIKEVENYSLDGVSNKRGSGIVTDSYDTLANSAGQDNLGQILLAILSFKRLAQKMGSEWTGGVLLIDEIDATLHPYAQERLFDLLKKVGREIDLQTVFTTHSMSLLEHISKITSENRPEASTHGVELYYLTTGNGSLDIKQNPSYSSIRNDLTIGSSSTRGAMRARSFTEDAEARWLIEQLLHGTCVETYCSLVDAEFGFGQLRHLYTHDYEYLRDRIIIFDGDVADEDIGEIPKPLREKGKNIVRLPGSVRPEQVVYEYLISLSSEHPIWRDAEQYETNKDYFIARGPLSDDYKDKGSERSRYKSWFKDNLMLLEGMRVVEHWKQDNPDIFNSFMREYISAYNVVASRICAYPIPKSLSCNFDAGQADGR